MRSHNLAQSCIDVLHLRTPLYYTKKKRVDFMSMRSTLMKSDRLSSIHHCYKRVFLNVHYYMTESNIQKHLNGKTSGIWLWHHDHRTSLAPFFWHQQPTRSCRKRRRSSSTRSWRPRQRISGGKQPSPWQWPV